MAVAGDLIPAFVPLADLTTADVSGAGVFDVLMRANKAHLDQELTKGRLKGPEYATVYLGVVEATMKAALDFLLKQRTTSLQDQLIDVQRMQAEAQTALIQQQKANAVIEGDVLRAQECKLKAEFELTKQATLKTLQETTLLTWKTTTEKAQTTALGVDDDSVVGRQKLLFRAQADGFVRDAEQKAAKILVDTWSVRRTSDDGVVADTVNNLNDSAVGRAVSKLLAGVAA